jgi:hypothetical protein
LQYHDASVWLQISYNGMHSVVLAIVDPIDPG